MSAARMVDRVIRAAELLPRDIIQTAGGERLRVISCERSGRTVEVYCHRHSPGLVNFLAMAQTVAFAESSLLTVEREEVM